MQQLELAILRGESGAPGPSGGAAAGRTAQAPAGTDGGAPGGATAEDDDPVSGDHVLERLVGAGLLEEGPRGQYRMHDLLRAFARAAAADGVGGRAARTERGTGHTPHPTPRPGAAELHPTEA